MQNNLNLYCYCIGDQVIIGPVWLPTSNLLGKDFALLDVCNYSDEELKKFGWYPWVMPEYLPYDVTKFKAIPYRYCNGEYATEKHEIVPVTDE